MLDHLWFDARFFFVIRNKFKMDEIKVESTRHFHNFFAFERLRNEKVF